MDFYNINMNSEQLKQSCKNCKYFIQHYVIINNAFYTANCGHCTARKITPKDRRSFPFISACELWETDEAEKEKQNESIKRAIFKMQKNLSEILQILKSN